MSNVKPPLATGLFNFFPDALAYVAIVSAVCNAKHHGPNSPLMLHDKAGSNPDALLRHFAGRGSIDPDSKLRHTGLLAWRALAMLQTELERLMIAHDGTSVATLTPEELSFGLPSESGSAPIVDRKGRRVEEKN